MRLIDAEKELKELKNMKVEGEVFTTAVNFAIKVIEGAPSIDIVRCGECKYRKNRIDYEKDYCIEHSKVIFNTDDYCSWAERSSE